MDKNIFMKLYFYIISKGLIFKNIPNKRIWREAFIRYFTDSRYGYETNRKEIIQNKGKLLKGFACHKLSLAKKSNKADCDANKPILISVMQNELEKMPLFFAHYRKLGIEKFVIIDNMSSDGTMEYLAGQEDVEVYRVNEKFSGSVKEGWICQILAQYGFRRWYLVVDADELLTWPQMDQKSLCDMIKIFQKKRQYRPLAIMLDMYSEGASYQKKSKNIYEDFCYFDKDSYYWIDNKTVDILSGGPRKRVLNNEAWLSKTPLFYLRPFELFCCAHYMYPYMKCRKPQCVLALLHYKFAYKNSYKNMKNYMKSGVDGCRIAESKIYINKRRMRFFYEGSACMDKSEKLCEIPYVVK